jgi:hypothetical protein
MKHDTIEKKYKELISSGVCQYEAALLAIGVDPDLAKEGAETTRKFLKEA